MIEQEICLCGHQRAEHEVVVASAEDGYTEVCHGNYPQETKLAWAEGIELGDWLEPIGDFCPCNGFTEQGALL